MADVDLGEVAEVLGVAAAGGGSFPPPGVPDTPATRALWEQIKADIAAMPAGVAPDVVWDYTDDQGGRPKAGGRP